MKLRIVNVVLRLLERVSPGEALATMRDDFARLLPEDSRRVEEYRREAREFDRCIDEALRLVERFQRESARDGFTYQNAMQYHELFIAKQREVVKAKKELIRYIEEL